MSTKFKFKFELELELVAKVTRDIARYICLLPITIML